MSRLRPARLALVLAALAALLLAPTGASALTKAAADRAALAALKPGARPGLVVVYGLRSPLAPRTYVVEAGPSAKSQARAKTVMVNGEPVLRASVWSTRLKGRAWLYWEDLAPGMGFVHPSRLLLVDDETGRVLARRNLSWWPLVNDKRPAFLASRTVLLGRKFRVFSRFEARPKPARAAAVGAPRPPLRAPAAIPSVPPVVTGECAVLMGDRADPILTPSFAAMNQVLRELHIPTASARSALDLDKQLDDLETRNPPCRDAIIFIAAHGLPALGSNYKDPRTGERVPETAHAQVTLKTEVQLTPQSSYVDETPLDAPSLREILRHHATRRGTTFKLIVTSCFAGRWLELNDAPGMRVILTSSRRDQLTPSAFQEGGTYQKGTQTDAMVTLGNDTITNTTVNPAHSDGFTNAVAHGLDAWAHSMQAQQDTGGDLAKGLLYNFDANQAQANFGAQLGWATPQKLDQSGNTAPPPDVETKAVIASSPNSPPTTPKAGVPVHFDASGSTGTIVRYDWTFEGGGLTTIVGKTADHAFPAPGVYSVNLKVTDERGVSDAVNQTIYVSGGGNKSASENDLPCPTATFPSTAVTVDIRIPHYAQNPTAHIVDQPTCPNTTVSNFTVSLVPGNDIGELDEWGNQKDHLHITFTVSGDSGSTATGSYTVLAGWD